MTPPPPPPPAVAPATSAPAASVARAQLAQRGDDYVVARYYATCGGGSGARRTAAGDPGWVALTAELIKRGRMGSACDGEAMPILLGEAMALRPSVVLPLVGRSPELSPAAICLPLRIEPTPAQMRKDVSALRQAMARVSEPALERAKAECLRQGDHYLQQVKPAS